MYTNIKDIISEAVFEGFASKRKFGRPADPNAPRRGLIRIDKCTTEELRSSVTGNKKECIMIYLGHVFSDGAQKLVDAIKAAVPQHVISPAVNANGSSKVVLRVNIDMKSEIPMVIPKLRDAIISVGDYAEKSVDTLCERLMDAVDSVVTSKDVETANASRARNWKEMLERLKDPEVRKSLLAYQTTNAYGEQYGHVLSANNVSQILSQCPTASFVTEASTWAKLFDRRVNPGAQRIIVTKADNANYGKYLNQAAKMMGYDSYQDAKKNTNNSNQVMGRIRIIAGNLGGGARNFYDVIMYDVADTTPNDPNNDIWTREIGLSNNLTGELNRAAEEFDKSSNKSKEQMDKIKANREKIEKAKNLEMPNRRAQLKRLCTANKLGIKIDTDAFDGLSDIDFIAKASHQFAKEAASKFGVVLPKSIENLANLATIVVCQSSGIDPGAVTSVRMYYPNAVTEEDAMHTYAICDLILPRLGKAIRPQGIEKIKNESMRRGRLTEKTGGRMIPFGKFLQMSVQRYGQAEPEEEGISGVIEGIIKEEVQRAMVRRFGRR